MFRQCVMRASRCIETDENSPSRPSMKKPRLMQIREELRRSRQHNSVVNPALLPCCSAFLLIYCSVCGAVSGQIKRYDDYDD